jgi:hypothetical protein
MAVYRVPLTPSSTTPSAGGRYALDSGQDVYRRLRGANSGERPCGKRSLTQSLPTNSTATERPGVVAVFDNIFPRGFFMVDGRYIAIVGCVADVSKLRFAE